MVDTKVGTPLPQSVDNTWRSVSDDPPASPPATSRAGEAAAAADQVEAQRTDTGGPASVPPTVAGLKPAAARDAVGMQDLLARSKAVTTSQTAVVGTGATAGATQTHAAKALHVDLFHVDGLRPDVLQAMIRAGELPHFQFVANRGKVSYHATTSDKSETNAIIPTILSGVQDTTLTGWWGFRRAAPDDPKSSFAFWNVWLDPRGVVNNEDGYLERKPMLPDYAAYKGLRYAAGFSQMDRGTPAKNASHAFVEGAKAALGGHTYYDQAHASATGFNGVIKAMAKRGEYPAISNTVIAPADEFGHLEGVLLATDMSGKYVLPPGVTVTATAAPGAGVTARATFQRQKGKARDKDPHERVFKLLEDDPGDRLARLRGKPERVETTAAGTRIEHYATGHFRTLERDAFGRLVSFGLDLPSILDTAGGVEHPVYRFAFPRYALALSVVDIELGNHINTLRNTRLDGGRVRWANDAKLGIDNFSPDEESLYRYTTLILYGDHGMVDTPNMYGKPDAISTAHKTGGTTKSLRETLEEKLWQAGGGKATDGATLVALDDTNVPPIMQYSHLDPSWQTPEMKAKVDKVREPVERWMRNIDNLLALPETEHAWWAPAVRWMQKKIAGKTTDAAHGYADQLLNTLVDVRLNRDPEYAKAAAAARQRYLDGHVGAIYGGAARNNAELFIPAGAGTDRTWARRPSYAEIMKYRGDDNAGPTLVDALRQTDGVGLILIRKDNDQTETDGPLGVMTIAVLDKQGHEGTITVRKGEQPGTLRYKYDAPRDGDPLGGWGGREGTYEQWNTWSTEAALDPNASPAQRAFHNVIAGLGGRLYSKNPTLGDIMVIHDAAWNFDTNVAGHGGSDAAEKLTAMMVSGPGITPGELTGRGRYQIVGGEMVEQPFAATPSVFDILPTALDQLGQSEAEFTDFAKHDFKPYLQEWLKKVPADVYAGLVPSAVDKLAAVIGKRDELKGFIGDMLGFLELDLGKMETLPEDYRLLGGGFDLGEQPPVKSPLATGHEPR